MHRLTRRKDPVLITGATGILGSWVLGEALTRGYRPIVLMRDGDPERALARIQAVLGLIGHADDLDSVQIVRGDTRLPRLGLCNRTANEVRGKVALAIHCAASTSFNPKDDETVWATNVAGASHLIEFISDANAPLFHVSTAYVAGARGGIAYEHELDAPHGFTNTYERSKWEAERLVRDAFDARVASGAVFRPGIIVGSSADGAISDFQNVYGFLRLIDLALARKTNGSLHVRVEGNRDTVSNFVPVDWTAKVLWHIIEQEGPSGRTYHLTNPHGNTLGELKDWVNETLKPSGVRFELVDQLESASSPVELMARSAFQHYRPYTKRQPRFDDANTARATGGHYPFPEEGPAYYEKLLTFARRHRWKGILAATRKKASAPRPTAVNV